MPKVPGDGLAKLKKPASDSFVGNIETALREEVFYISITQCETAVEPDSVTDDFRWKAMALEG